MSLKLYNSQLVASARDTVDRITLHVILANESGFKLHMPGDVNKYKFKLVLKPIFSVLFLLSRLMKILNRTSVILFIKVIGHCYFPSVGVK